MNKMARYNEFGRYKRKDGSFVDRRPSKISYQYCYRCRKKRRLEDGICTWCHYDNWYA